MRCLHQDTACSWTLMDLLGFLGNCKERDEDKKIAALGHHRCRRARTHRITSLPVVSQGIKPGRRPTSILGRFSCPVKSRPGRGRGNGERCVHCASPKFSINSLPHHAAMFREDERARDTTFGGSQVTRAASITVRHQALIVRRGEGPVASCVDYKSKSHREGDGKRRASRSRNGPSDWHAESWVDQAER